MLPRANNPFNGEAIGQGRNGNGDATTIRIVIVARRQLDAEGLAALCQKHPLFRVLTAVNQLEAAALLCQHRRPDVLLVDADLVGADACRVFAALIDQFVGIPILIVDDEIHDARLAALIGLPQLSYFSRNAPFVELASGIERLARGERAFETSLLERLQETPQGWTLRRNVTGSPFAHLTPREIEVLRLIALGNTIKACAKQLSLSPSTVDNHKTRLMKKLGVHRSLELTRLAVKEGLITL